MSLLHGIKKEDPYVSNEEEGRRNKDKMGTKNTELLVRSLYDYVPGWQDCITEAT